MMRTRIAAFIGAATLGLALLTGCGGDDSASAPPAATVTVTEGAGITVPSPPDVDLTGLDDYPREIPITRIPGIMRSHVESGGGKTDVVVAVGPHVYAIRGHGELGVITDYTAVFGLCSDVKQFERRTGLSLGSTCW